MCANRLFQLSLVYQRQIVAQHIKSIHFLPNVGNRSILKQCQTHHKQLFHTSQKRPSPILWVLLKPLLKIGAILSGRRIRYWLKSDPKNKILAIKEIRKNKHWIAKIGIGITLYGFYYYYTHLEETPITHRKRFIAFSQTQFEKIADFESKIQTSALQGKIITRNHPYYSIVISVLRRLFDANKDIPQLDKMRHWNVSIIDDPGVNAFVLPNGQIYVFAGMLKLVQNVDQLGIVLGHEMSHALLGHAIELVSYAHLLDFLIIIVLAALWAFVPTDGIAVITQWFYQKVIDITLQMPYSRKLESEADFVGLELASKACFDVREAVKFWKIMEWYQKHGKKVQEGEGLVITPPEWLSTHPANEKRAEYLENLLPKALELRRACHCPDLPN